MIKLPGALGGGNNRIMVGIELGNDFSRLSYCGQSEEVETLSTVAGAESYSIPTALCKRVGANQWFFGRDALRYAQEEDGILVNGLLEKAYQGTPVEVDGNYFQPVSLLTLYLKRTLNLLGKVTSLEQIEALMITVHNLDQRCLEVLKEAVDGLRLKTDQVFFQSTLESFYHYMIRQPSELWHQGTVLMEYLESKILVYRMESNLRTSPIVVYIGESEHLMGDEARSNQMSLEKELQQRDMAFRNLCEEICQGGGFASVYLVGDRFSNQWMNESLNYLCNRSRVFQGNNLYSKGACYGLQDRLTNNSYVKEHVFLGNDKLRSNVGMKILRQGEETYFALLDAGVNWFEATQEFEFYMQDGRELCFEITNLVSGTSKTAMMQLMDFSGNLSRMRANLFLSDDHTLVVDVEDLGLGNFRPATHHVWRENIPL